MGSTGLPCAAVAGERSSPCCSAGSQRRVRAADGGCRQAAPGATDGLEDRPVEKGDGDLDCPGMDERQQPGCMVACKAASQLVGERLERLGMLLRCLDTPAGSGKRQCHCRAFETQETPP